MVEFCLQRKLYMGDRQNTLCRKSQMRCITMLFIEFLTCSVVTCKKSIELLTLWLNWPESGCNGS